jgi:hypothetical protein
MPPRRSMCSKKPLYSGDVQMLLCDTSKLL